MKLLSAPLPPEWQRILESRCAFYHRLPETDRRELTGHLMVFLAEKNFEGCDGFSITDETRVCIAAFACLLLIHRRTDYYPRLRTILVYPASYVSVVTRSVGMGVISRHPEARAGESWSTGAVVLAWEEVCRGLREAAPTNVVLHEFAHQLDYEDGGDANGIPALGESEPLLGRKSRATRWQQVMIAEYEGLRARLQRNESGLLRPYGASSPVEFFAVATESFFCQPRELERQHPALYAELKWYYQQDPARWLDGGSPDAILATGNPA